MAERQPHFLLFSGADPSDGRWHFVLETVEGRTVLKVSDTEAGIRGERLELLAVVRGLEALDQPSRVTLVTASRRVARGFRFGLDEWRNRRWRWERDGRWVPIKNRDLWQRVDRALQFHRVKCRTWRIDPAHHSGTAFGGPPPVATRLASTRTPVVRHPERETLGERLAAAMQSLLHWPASQGNWAEAS